MSRRVMDLIRSLMSWTGKDRSIRCVPSTDPSRWKYPTPLENSTTCEIGNRDAVGDLFDSLASLRADERPGCTITRAAAATAATTPATVQSLRMTIPHGGRTRDRRTRHSDETAGPTD